MCFVMTGGNTSNRNFPLLFTYVNFRYNNKLPVLKLKCFCSLEKYQKGIYSGYLSNILLNYFLSVLQCLI